MINFEYVRASSVADAIRQIAAEPRAKFIAGGTNLVDLMKEEVERPFIFSRTRLHLAVTVRQSGVATCANISLMRRQDELYSRNLRTASSSLAWIGDDRMFPSHELTSGETGKITQIDRLTDEAVKAKKALTSTIVSR